MPRFARNKRRRWPFIGGLLGYVWDAAEEHETTLSRLEPVSFLSGHIHGGADFEGLAPFFTDHLPCPFDDEHLVLPPVNVERCVPARLESKEPHGKVFRTVLFRDQRPEFHALQIMLGRKVSGIGRFWL